MKELWTVFVNWAWQKKENRPFVLLGLAVPLFLLTQEIWGWTWSDTLFHWFLWRTFGAILIVIGVIHVLLVPDPPGYPLRPRPLHPRLVFAAFTFAGTALIFFSFPRPLPSNRLVVTIGQFTPVSALARDKAADIADRIKQSLLARAQQGAPLEVKLIDESVRGIDSEAEQSAARALGTSWHGNANVVLWGEVRTEENELFVSWHMTIVRHPAYLHLQDRVEEFTDIQPSHIEAEEKLSEGIADLVTLVYGLAYYHAQQWNNAIQMLSASESRQAQLYRGISLVDRSRESPNPPSDLRTAIATYEALLGPNSNVRIAASTDQFTLAVILDRADATAMLAVYSLPKDAVALLTEAVQTFNDALATPALLKEATVRTSIQNNLALAKQRLALVIGNTNVSNLLGRSVADTSPPTGPSADAENVKRWEESANRCRSATHPKENPSYSENCAEVFEALAFSNREKARALVEESIAARNVALTNLLKTRYPQSWATLQFQLGRSYLFLGIQSSTPDLDKNAQHAADAFRASLTVWRRDICPICWAQAEDSLALSLSVQAYQTPSENSANLANEAITTWKSAQEVYTENDLPASWAEVQAQILGTRSWLGELIGGKEGKDLLHQAVDEYSQFLRMYYKTESTLKADPINPLWHGLIALRTKDGDPNHELLNELIDTMELDTRYAQSAGPYSRARLYASLGDSLSSRQKEFSTNEEKTIILRKVISAYRSALRAHPPLETYEQLSIQNSLIDRQIDLAGIVRGKEGEVLLQESVRGSRSLIARVNGKLDLAIEHYMLGISLADLADFQTRSTKIKMLKQAVATLDASLALLSGAADTKKRESISATRSQVYAALVSAEETKP